jgi:hypothetical protein
MQFESTNSFGLAGIASDPSFRTYVFRAAGFIVTYAKASFRNLLLPALFGPMISVKGLNGTGVPSLTTSFDNLH